MNSLFNIGSQRVESRMILLQVQVQSRTDRASDGIRKSARFLLTNETPQLFPDCELKNRGYKFLKKKKIEGITNQKKKRKKKKKKRGYKCINNKKKKK